MRAAAAVLLTTVVCVACARSGGEDRPDTAGRGQALSGSDTAIPTPAASESTATQPPISGGTASTPVRRPSAIRPPAPSASPPRPSGSPSDTARGVVAVVGSVPITEVVLRPAAGRPITLTGTLAREIGVASGADVWVRGRRINARTMDVESYAVRSVDGVTAITGTLAADGDRLVLVADDGRRHPIARPPTPLREHVGARVWIAGDLGSTINSYGVLRRAR